MNNKLLLENKLPSPSDAITRYTQLLQIINNPDVKIIEEFELLIGQIEKHIEDLKSDNIAKTVLNFKNIITTKISNDINSKIGNNKNRDIAIKLYESMVKILKERKDELKKLL